MSEFTLPEGWVETPLGEYLYLKNGYAFKSNSYVAKGDDTVPVIRISDIDGKLATDETAIHVKKADVVGGFEIKKGDLLIAMSGATTGKVGVYNGSEPAYQNQRVGNLKLLSDLFGSAKYKDHLIASLTPEILKVAYGGAQPNISGKAIEEFLVALPPLAEQQQIAQKLDELLAQVDALKTRLDAIPNILKRFRQSVLAAAVSGRLTEGEVDLRLVGDVCEKAFDGPFGSKLKTSDYTDAGVRVARLENVGHLIFDNDKQTFISKEKAAELESNKLKLGDVLFSSFVDEEVRVCAFKQKELFINKADCFCLRPDPKKVSSEFLAYTLSSVTSYFQIKDQVQGVTRPRINLRILKSLSFNFPAIEEQTEIVRRVEQLFAYADQIEQRVKDAQARVNHLTQSILAKAFRGELTAEWRAQNPELISGENSAAALLERIRVERERFGVKRKLRKED